MPIFLALVLVDVTPHHYRIGLCSGRIGLNRSFRPLFTCCCKRLEHRASVFLGKIHPISCKNWLPILSTVFHFIWRNGSADFLQFQGSEFRGRNDQGR